MIREGTYYLSNSGTRCVTFGPDGKKIKCTLRLDDGTEVQRTVVYEEAFGNFGLIAFYYKGKLRKRFPESFEYNEDGGPKLVVELKTHIYGNDK